MKTFYQFILLHQVSGRAAYANLVSLGDHDEARQQIVAEYPDILSYDLANFPRVIYALDEDCSVVPLDAGHRRTCWASARISAMAFGLLDCPPETTIAGACFRVLLKHNADIDLLATYIPVRFKRLPFIDRLFLRRWLARAQADGLVLKSGSEYLLRPITRGG